MKTIVLTMVIFALGNIVFAQNPTYILDVNDGWQMASNSYEFDIDLTWTNTGVVSQFEYAGGQFFFDFNKDIANGGTLSLSIVGSQLPANMQPRNPTAYTVTTPGQLRLAVNTFPGAGLGYIMPPGSPVKIVRARIQTTANEFAQVPLNLTWRNALPNPFAKLFAYVAGVNTDISTPPTHILSIANNPLVPVNFNFSSPANNSSIDSNLVHMTWNTNLSHDSFILLISKNPGMTSIVYYDSAIVGTSTDAYIRNAGIDLYALLFSRHNGNLNGMSNQIVFRISNNMLKSYPTDNDSLVLYNPKLVWREFPQSVSYHVIVSEDSLFNSKIFEDSTVTDTLKSITGLKHRHNYYWRVTAKDTGDVVTAVSSISKFRSVYPINLEVKCALQGMYNPLAGILNRKDSISVYLRRATSPFQIVDSAKASIDTVSLIAYPGFKNAPAGSYYVVVKHFNSIETWSKVGGLSLQANGYPLLYDFTTSASQAYGNNMRLKGGKYCIYSGDVNQDGVIDGTDLSRIDNSAAFYEVGQRLPEDLDANGIVDADDFAIGDNNWYFITVITPMSPFNSEIQNEDFVPKVEP